MKYYTDPLIEENERLNKVIDGMLEPWDFAELGIFGAGFSLIFGSMFFYYFFGWNWWIGFLFMLLLIYFGMMMGRIK